jgi:hypothetical protein
MIGSKSGVQRLQTFGARVGRREAQKKIDSPDEREPSGEIF